MKKLLVLFVAGALAPSLFAQLSIEQREVDFKELVALFAKRYAFYEWKRDAFKYDGLAIGPWLDRVRNAKDDLEFFEVASEYVASYMDGHTGFSLPSTYRAKLGFTTDLYDGKVLIDSIDRNILSSDTFPFQVGDELVSIDGKPAQDAMAAFTRFIGDGNTRTIRRITAFLLTGRNQNYIPRAHEIGDTAAVVIQRQGGAQESYTIPWQKKGIPYTMAGPVTTPRITKSIVEAAEADDEPIPPYMQTYWSLQNFHARNDQFALGEGAVKPVFALPDNFVQRLGASSFDRVFTGTFDAGGKKIGFLRIPDFVFYGTSTLEKEIAFFNAATDGLIVDVMRNPGGLGCASEGLAARLTRDDFHSLGASFRATWDLVMSLQQDLDAARQSGADDDAAKLEKLLQAMRDAFAQERGFTYPMAVCGPSKDIPAARDRNGQPIGYSKPVLILTDEFSASAAELFAAIMQDNKRAMLYGYRTDGAGGSVNSYNVGFYMEGRASLARSILVRAVDQSFPDYPTAPYIENIGVRPDKVSDYMTADNLANSGKPFFNGAVQALLDYIASK